MADLSQLYDWLAPAPNTEYGSMLPFARDAQTGNRRWAMPAMVREGLKGYLDLAQGTETGQITPEALQTMVFGGLGAGAAMVPRGALAAGGARPSAPIRAYHGSPHSFDRFDSSKINTGEGVQAYGHGLYFAEDPTVARTYRGKVSAMHGMEAPTVGGRPINWDDPIETAAFELARHGGDRNAAAEFFARAFKPDSQIPGILRSDAVLPDVKLPGHMYEVGIHADPAKFLDWDKPLSAQSGDVRNTLSQFSDFGARPVAYGAMRDNYYKPMQEILSGTDAGRFVRPENFFDPGKVDLAAVRQSLASDPDRIAKMDALIAKYQADTAPTGKDAYHWLARADEGEGLTRAKGSENVAYNLGEAGIPGIRYLDQGSRSAGQGSSNYVVFPGQENIIEILRKYGLMAPAPVAMGGNAGTPTPEQRQLMNPGLF